MFDSWAGTLSPTDYRELVLPHSTQVFRRWPARHPDDPTSGWAPRKLLGAMGEAGATVVGVDWRTAVGCRHPRPPGTALQGNLDPSC